MKFKTTLTAIILWLNILAPTLANAASVTSEVVIQPTVSSTPTAPVLDSYPSSTCHDTLLLSGTAQPSTTLYINDTVNSDTDISGNFTATVSLSLGENIFGLKVLSGSTYSTTTTATITRVSCSTGTTGGGSGGGGFNPYPEHPDPIPTIEVPEEILEVIDEEISETISVDEELTPLSPTPESKPTPPLNDYPYIDTDEDGIADYIERIIGLDPFNTDTDGDGVTDNLEIRIGQTITKFNYELTVNVGKRQTLTCGEIPIQGALKKIYENGTKIPVQNGIISACIVGSKSEQCTEIITNVEGAFGKTLRLPMKEGNYMLRLNHDNLTLLSDRIICTDSRYTGDTLIARLNKSKTYKSARKMYQKTQFLVSFTNKPRIKGFAPSISLVTTLFLQDALHTTHTITVSDGQGYFETQSPIALETFLGFGKAKVSSYASHESKLTGVDEITFYIIDWRLIFVALLLIYIQIRIRKKRYKIT